MKKGIIVFLLLAAAAAAVYYGFQAKRRTEAHDGADGRKVARRLPAVTVTLKAGGEKMGLLNDTEVRDYLDREYHLQLQAAKEGSVEMVRQPLAGLDALWPASEYCRQEFETRAQREGIRFTSEDIFNSPIVIPSWPQVAQALARPDLHIVELRDGIYYLSDMPKLVGLVHKGTHWKDLGLPLHGRVGFKATDPTRSNSGSMLAGLLANILNGGDPCPLDKVESVLPAIREIFGLMGLKEVSSGDIFEHFLAQGLGSYPMVVAYENQLLEAIGDPNAPATLRSEVVVFYPEPTVWSSHPFIALTDNGKRLQAALRDPVIQKLAWERHGFRTGSIGASNDPQVFKARGIPRQILAATPAPEYRVMDLITRALGAPTP